MVFSSFEFLFRFLPAFLIIYFITPKKFRNAVLFLGSIAFYTYGEAQYVLLLLASVTVNYVIARSMYKTPEDGRGRRQAILLILALCYDFGMLFFFKYSGLTTKLPLGISFYTFQIAAYVIDVYRGIVPAEKSYVNLGTYLTMFPQLIAGPIVKYHDIQKQIETRKTDVQEIAEGFRRFTIGLAKKVLISNTVAIAADGVFNSQIGEINIVAAWIGAISYMLQIYYDFSGYSDMAIGMGHMFGFHFQENFNYPYISASIKEFWRRWHISLSTWFKEYLYIPLGGNRKGKIRTCVNKMVVFSATGLWHGASWTFVLWGVWHGVFSLIEEFLPIRKLPGFFRHIYAMLVVCIGFVMFRADTFSQGIQMIETMFTGWNFDSTSIQVAVYWLNPFYLVILFVGIFGCMPILRSLHAFTERTPVVKRIVVPFSYVGSVLLLLLSMLSLSSGTYNPFIYFRF